MAARREPTTVQLSAEQRAAIEAAQQEMLARTGIRPSLGDVMRAAIDAGLQKLGADRR